MQQQHERIEELEEALRESVRITAQREIVVADKQSFLEAADEKVMLTLYLCPHLYLFLQNFAY